MTSAFSSHDLRAVLLDIEGTTTPLSFVHDVLFPFAQEALPDWCRTHAGSDVYRQVMMQLAAEHAADRDSDQAVPDWHDETPDEADRSLQAYVRWLMALDRKSTGLKVLQGSIWEEGYRSGVLHGDVYPDVPAALRRWHDHGIVSAIYSSGSELAQRRLFESTVHGDLTPLIAGFFDTTLGPKQSAASYRAIATRLGVEPSEIVFVSDVTAELAAASAVGFRTALSIRPGNRPQSDAQSYPHILTFDEILP